MKPPNYLLSNRFVQGALALAFLMGILYCCLYVNTTLPSQLGITLKWERRTEHLEIAAVHPNNDGKVKEGDVVLAVNGKTSIRGEQILPIPRPAIYKLTLEREGQQIEVDYKPIDNSPRIFTDVYAAIVMWGIGAAILFVGDLASNRVIAIAFMVLALNWVSIPAFILGIPFTWLFGYVSLPLLSVLYSQFGSIEKRTNESGHGTGTKIWLTLAIVWSLAGVLEYLYLFPRSSNIYQLIGIEWLSVSYLSIAVGFLTALAILAYRTYKTSPSYLKHQLIILCILGCVAILPFVLFTVFPNVILGTVILPAPVAFAMMLLLPCGFLFVILRRRHLFFEQLTTRLLLAISLVIIVAIIISITRLMLSFRGQSVPNETWILLLVVGVIGFYPNNTLLDVARRILFGHDLLGQSRVYEIGRKIITNPRWDTVESVLHEVSLVSGIEHLYLYKREGNKYKLTASSFPLSDEVDCSNTVKLIEPLPSKAAYINMNFGCEVSKCLVVPVQVMDVPTGFIVAQKDQGETPFSERDLVMLNKLANVLAMGLPTIEAFEAMDNDSAVSLYSREKERQKLAAELHDGPLQDMLALHLDSEDQERVNKIASELRRLCHDLHNPILDDDIVYVAKDVLLPYKKSTLKTVLNTSLSHHTISISDRAKLAFYYVLKEALSNVAKHANANRAVIDLSDSSTSIVLRIVDDGVGMPARNENNFLPINEQGAHRGLSNMSYWTRLVGGTLEIKSVPMNGTMVTATLPIETVP